MTNWILNSLNSVTVSTLDMGQKLNKINITMKIESISNDYRTQSKNSKKNKFIPYITELSG